MRRVVESRGTRRGPLPTWTTGGTCSLLCVWMTTSSGQGWGKGRLQHLLRSRYPGCRLVAKYRAEAGLSWSYGRLRYQQLEGTSKTGM